jgi:ABC-type transporter Mla subunit MlaD
MTSEQIRQAIADLKSQYAACVQVYELYNATLNAKEPVSADLLDQYQAAQQFGSTYNSVLADLEAQLVTALEQEKIDRVTTEAAALEVKVKDAIAKMADVLTTAAASVGGNASTGNLADLYFFWRADGWPSGILAQTLQAGNDLQDYLESLPSKRARAHVRGSYGMSPAEQATAESIIASNNWNS